MIKSSLDLHRKLPAPPLEPGEQILKKCTGTIELNKYSLPAFQPCNIYLTDRRLLLAQVTNIKREFRFNQILQLTIVKRPGVMGKQIRQIKISMKNGGAYFVAMNKPEEWLLEMAKRGKMRVEKKST